MEFITNPWVISFIAMAIIIGNLLAMKYVGRVTSKKMPKMTRKEELDKLIALDKKLSDHAKAVEEKKKAASNDADSTQSK